VDGLAVTRAALYVRVNLIPRKGRDA